MLRRCSRLLIPALLMLVVDLATPVSSRADEPPTVPSARVVTPATVGVAVVVPLRDYVGRTWSDELVHHDLSLDPAANVPPLVQVKRPDGTAIPSQITDELRDPDTGHLSGLRVWWFADVPAHGEAVYSLTPGVAGPTADGVVVTRSAAGDSVTLSTAVAGAAKPIGIRLPLGAVEYPWPVEPSTVPGPIAALLSPSGHEIGNGTLRVPFRVKSWQAELGDVGPLFAEVTVRYVFETGYWTFRARVLRGCPMIQFDEEVDNGHSGQTWENADRYYTLDLTAAPAAPNAAATPIDGAAPATFKPTQMWYGSAPDRDEQFSTLQKGYADPAWITQGRTQANWFASKISGFDLTYAADREDFYLSGYPTVQGRVGCFARVLQPDGDAIGVAGLHTARWRNPHSLRLRETATGHFEIALPLQAFDRGWGTDGFGEGSRNYTGVTRFVPDSTLRRSWGLMLSSAEDEKTAHLASLIATGVHLSGDTLDAAQDMILDWPDPLAGTAFPETSTPAGLAALAYLRDKVAYAEHFGRWAEFSMAYHFGFAIQNFPKFAAVANSTTDLSAADRQEFRRLAAYFAYTMNSEDTFPLGTGFHLNNPNMTIMAVLARVRSSLLIADHPMYKAWGAVTLEILKDFLVRFTRPNGAAYENAHYTLGVTFIQAAEANQALMEAGLGDAFDTPLFKRTMYFVLNYLTPPERRYSGHRVVIPFGNASYQSYPVPFGEAFVGYYATRDPELAARLQWAVNQTLPEDKQLKIVPEDMVPDLKSVRYQDYGIYFRHGFGTPYETLFFMLAGDCDGHFEWESDQMAYTLYAKGQPINLHFGNGYFSMFCRPWLRNRVSFDHMFEHSEQNPTTMTAASLTPALDYVQATRQVTEIRPLSEYPAMTPKGQAAPEEAAQWPAFAPWQTIPAVTWHRQVLFLKDVDPKGPNYFVMRETFSGTPTRPTDLSLWFLANKMETPSPDVFHFDGQQAVDMDVFVHSPAGQTPETGTFGHINQPYGRAMKDDLTAYPNKVRREDQLFMRLKQPRGEGYMVVLYPRLKENDPAATYSRLGDSTVKVTTPIGVDYVFANPWSTSFTDDQVSGSGVAGAVRLYTDGRTQVINSEGAATFTVKGKTITGTGAFTVTIAADGAVAVERQDATATVDVK